MKFVDLLRQPIPLITENDILKDIVFPDDNAQAVFDKIKGKPAEDLLVVFVNPDKQVQGVITSTNVVKFLDEMIAKNSPLEGLKVSELEWDKHESIWLRKDDIVESVLKKLATTQENIFIVVDSNSIYAGKIKRKNALSRIRELSD